MKASMLSLTLAFAGTLLIAPAPAGADVLLVERVQAEAGKALPARGLTMAQVEAAFGAPTSKHPPVAGPNSHRFNPPITRWVYPSFSVYFERDKVIDAVANRSHPGEAGPRPVGR